MRKKKTKTKTTTKALLLESKYTIYFCFERHAFVSFSSLLLLSSLSFRYIIKTAANTNRFCRFVATGRARERERERERERKKRRAFLRAKHCDL